MANKGNYDYDIYNTKEKFNKIEERIDESDMLAENKKLALEFKDYAHAAGLMGQKRILKYITFFKNLDDLLEKPFDQATKQDLMPVVSAVKSRDDWKQNTKTDFLRLLRRYYKIAAGMEDENDHPEIVKWIKVKPPKQKPLNFDELPHWEDVITMADYTMNVRDRALIKSLWESGSRIGEIMSLRVGDIESVEHGVYLNLQKSKTDPRKVFIKLSGPDVLEWLSVHPAKNDKKAPFFCKLNGDPRKVVSHRYVYKMLQRVKERAGIDKKIHPHMLRHGSASYFSDWLSDSDMDAKYGWVIGSKTKKRYTHKNPKSVETKILKMSGEKENGSVNIYEQEKTKQVECYYCGKINDDHRKTCWNCKRVLDLDVAEATQELKENVNDLVLEYMKENPKSLKGYMDFLGDVAEKELYKGNES